MSHLSLSATTATGLFTLLGTIIGGWQREDAREATASSRRAAEAEERKALYPQLLAKIFELNGMTFSTLLAVNPSYNRVKSFEYKDIPEDMVSLTMVETFTKVWPTFVETAREYENLKSRVLMIAGEEVRKRIFELQKRTVRKLMLACAGISVEIEEEDDPSDLLIEAMQSELGVI